MPKSINEQISGAERIGVAVSLSNTNYKVGYDSDLKNYFSCTTHETAYRSLLDGIHMHEGCVVLSGDAGAGKTSLLRKLVREASSSALELVHCPTGALDFDQLLAFVCDEIGLNLQAPDRSDSLAVFKQYLSVCYDANSVLVLIVDDAHMLREEVIDQLLALTRSGTVRRGLRLVLCGAPALLDRLGAWRVRYPVMASAFLVHLPRLTEAETAALVKHRLEAGALDLAVSEPAVECIIHHAHGLPGGVDTLCERALALARQRGDLVISDETVSQAAAELDRKVQPTVFTQPKLVPAPPAQKLDTAVSKAEHATPVQAPVRDPKAAPVDSSWQRAIPLSIVLLAPLIVGGWPVIVSNWSYFYGDKEPGVVSGVESPDPPAAPVASYRTVNKTEPVAVLVASDIALLEESVTEPALDADLQFWQRIKDSQDGAFYQDYLNAFPQGKFAKLADLRLQRLVEPQAEELNAIIAKARDAVEKKALTTPVDDNAVKWAETALQLDPQNEAAHQVLHTVIETYLAWSLQSLDRRRLSSASSYLQRVRTLEDHASEEQLAAIDVLGKQVSSAKRRTTRTQPKRVRSTRYTASRNSPASATAWFNQLDRDFQNLGRKIRQEASTFGQYTATSREQGFNSAR